MLVTKVGNTVVMGATVSSPDYTGGLMFDSGASCFCYPWTPGSSTPDCFSGFRTK